MSLHGQFVARHTPGPTPAWQPRRMSLINRRYFIQSVAATVAATVAACNGGTNARVVTLPTLPALTPDQLLAETQRRTFNYFWQTTEAAGGLAPDLAPDAAPASIA